MIEIKKRCKRLKNIRLAPSCYDAAMQRRVNCEKNLPLPPLFPFNFIRITKRKRAGKKIIRKYLFDEIFIEASKFISQSAYAEAEKILRNGIKQAQTAESFDDLSFFYKILGSIAVSKNDLPNAKKYYSLSEKYLPDAYSKFSSAKFLIEYTSEYNKAINKLKNALKLDIKHQFTAGILSYLGLAYLRRGHLNGVKKIIPELKKMSKRKAGLGMEPIFLLGLIDHKIMENEVAEIINNLIATSKRFGSRDRWIVFRKLSKYSKGKEISNWLK